jgi:DnaJ-domain-containing protein 1
LDSQYDKLGEMLKDAIKSGKFPESEKDSKKQNQQKIKQENLNQKTKKENSEKEFYSRKGDKKNKISDVNIQKSIHLYKIFNLNYGCTIEELKDSYRKLLKKYHPDNFEGFPETQKMAERKTQELISAFNKLMELIG